MNARKSAARGPNRPDQTWPRRLGAEAFGTFALVFVAAGGDTMALVSHGQVSVAARAVAPGLMVAALIYSLGDVSGAHLNPAVTLAFAAKRLFPLRLVGPYWLSQIAGSLAAAGLMHAMFGDAAVAGVSVAHTSNGVAFTLEAILTLLLLVVILGTADRYRVVGPDAALAVGATIAACGLIALPIDGASMNPARSLGPAATAGRYADLWIYVAGPCLGALLAAGLTRALHGPTEHDEKTEEAARGG